MLSYQHIYHAGNIVDCQKHAVLSALLSQLQGFHYIDTHAGRGLYDLTAPEAQKIREYADGIDKIWTLQNWPKEMRAYQHLLEELNPDGVCNFYPGSPLVAYAHAKTDDRLDLYEIHPQELVALDEAMSRYKNVAIHNVNGWEVLTQPIAETTNTVILIDPSYELKEEYTLMASRVAQVLHSVHQAIILIWYPLLKAGRHMEMLNAFRTQVNAPALKTEIHMGAVENVDGLYGTGLLLVNPPPGFDTIVSKISAWLTQALGKTTITEFLSK